MATISQAQRLVRVKTPLGDDVLVPTAFSGQEQISALFSFHLDVISTEDAITASDLVGKRITISIERVDDEPRFFDGFVNRLTNFGMSHYLARYQVEVVPWLWFLTRTANCRIFQNKSVPDIVQQVFKDHGMADFQLQLSGSFPPLEYCVQYRETAFDFVSRLLEREGIFYFFKHEDGKHTMVMANSKQAFTACPEQVVEFLRIESGVAQSSRIDKWQHDYEFRPGKWAQTDYNFKTPSNSLLTSAQTVVKLPGNSAYEVFDFPGDYLDTGSGQTYADLRMEENEAKHNLATGTSTCKTFSPGQWFELTRHEIAAEDGEYIITSVQHWASSAADAGGSGDTDEYGNTFTCIPRSVNYRPPRITSRPMIRGPQVAMVTGPAGEEIYTDKFGRVKVHFYWDRESKKDENSSCWVRVSQVHAGKGFGSIHTPRIGEEVIVVFYEGDPHRPVIAGRLYHAENMPPYALPGGASVSGVKSNSTKGGGGHNGLIMDDTKGKEKITLHGQYDMASTIEHDETHHVKNDRTITVDGKHTETINKDTSITVKTGNFVHDVQTGTAFYHVKAAVQEKFENSQDTIVKNGIHIASETAHIYIHTATNIQLHVGDSSIWMDSGGQISIKGNNIAIDGKESVTIHGGMVRSKADSTHEIEGGNCISDAKGSNTVKGGMVMLNP